MPFDGTQPQEHPGHAKLLRLADFLDTLDCRKYNQDIFPWVECGTATCAAGWAQIEGIHDFINGTSNDEELGLTFPLFTACFSTNDKANEMARELLGIEIKGNRLPREAAQVLRAAVAKMKEEVHAI